MLVPTPKVSDIKKKTVLVRVDFNVPLHKDGSVADAERIQSALETILFLREHQARIILMSHLGRPEGKRDQTLSLAGVADYLRHNTRLPIKFVADCIGEEVRQASQVLEQGQILLLENLRFYPEEETGDKTFAKQIIEDTGAEVFINEAFSASHRAHASIVGCNAFVPSFAGFSLAAEIKMMSKILEKAARPFVVVLGGAKIDDKVQAVENLSKLADLVVVGGGLANAFLKASGIEVHRSFMGKDAAGNTKLAKKLLATHQTERTMVAADNKRSGLPLPKIVVPVDVLAAKNNTVKDEDAVQTIPLLANVADTPLDLDLQYLDIGPETITLYKYLLSSAKTIFWNGPLGVFENPRFAKGSRAIARAIARATTENSALTICGGGETNAIINTCGLRNRFSHISTAGGAALEFLGGTALPGIVVLQRQG